MKVPRESFLFLKVVLIHTFTTERNYFFEWALASGNVDKIRLVLSELRNKLDELNRRFPDNPLLPSYEYQIAIDKIEFDCEKLANFLMCHESIDSVLFKHFYFLEQITTEFHEHFINKFLPLKTIVLQSTIHDSVFGKWVSKSTFYNSIKTISSNLKKYFSQIEFMREFIDAIRNMDNNPMLFQNFIKNHPTVILLLIPHIETLEDINKAFQEYLRKEQSEEKEDINYFELVKELYDFYSEDLQPSHKTKSHIEYTEEEKKASLARLKALGSNIHHVLKKDTQPLHESPTQFNLAFRDIKSIYKKTAIAIKKSKGDTQTIVNYLEELNSFLTSFLDIQEHLEIQFSWVKEKLFISRQSVEKTKEFVSEWSQNLNNFQYIAISSENQEILQEVSRALQQSDGNAEKILVALKYFEDKLHLIISSYPPEFKHYLTTKISWVKTTVERLRSKANITHFEKIEPEKGKEEEKGEVEVEIELLSEDFERKLTVLPVLATQPLTQIKEASKKEEKEEAFFMDYSKWIEKLNTFNSSDSAQNIFKKTAIELQKSDGDPKTALIALEHLETNLMLKQYVTPPETRKCLDAQLSWTRKKIKLMQLIITQLEKTEEEQKQPYVNCAEWIQMLNDFSNQYTSISSQSGVLNQFNLNHSNPIQKIFKKASSELQESNGDIMKIFDILELLETNLQLRIMSRLFRPIQEHLQKHADQVNEILKELKLQIKVYKAINKLDMNLKEKLTPFSFT